MRMEPLLDALRQSGAEVMKLEPGEKIYVLKSGSRLDVGREPLSHATLLQMVTETLNPLELSGLGEQSRTIAHRHGEEDFELEFGKTNGSISIAIRRKNPSLGDPAAVASFSSAPRPAEPTPPPPSPPSPAPQSGVSVAPTAGSVEMDELLRLMVSEDASDLHLSADAYPVLRVHGEVRFLEARGAMTSEDVQRLVYGILEEDVRHAFEAKRDADCAYEIPGLSRFRVNVFEDRKGVGCIIRQIPVEILTAEQLGLPPSVLELCFLTKGLVLVTGPTGSGKSTTLAAMVDHINKNRSDHMITIEDPIEFVHENQQCLINQRQVGDHTESFKAALRAALREDPDVVLVGEMRDLETIAIAIETAETCHLVFGTLHTTTAMATIDRIIDQFPPDQQAQIRVMLSDSLKGVVAQVLCKKKGGGRVAALEVLLGNSALASLIRDGKTFQIPSVMQTSKRQGMFTMNDSLLRLVKENLVEPKEAWMKAVDRSGLLGLFRSSGIPVDFAAGDGGK